MGEVVDMTGKKGDKEEKQIQAVFETAIIEKFSHKVDNFGRGVAKMEITLESDDPETDFAPLLGLQKFECSLGIQSGKIKKADL